MDPPALQEAQCEWFQRNGKSEQFTRIRDLHRMSLNLFQYQ